MLSASENPFKENLTSLPKPGGGEFGKFYSLPSLNDPRIGKLVSLFLFLFFFSFFPSDYLLLDWLVHDKLLHVSAI